MVLSIYVNLKYESKLKVSHINKMATHQDVEEKLYGSQHGLLILCLKTGTEVENDGKKRSKKC